MPDMMEEISLLGFGGGELLALEIVGSRTRRLPFCLDMQRRDMMMMTTRINAAMAVPVVTVAMVTELIRSELDGEGVGESVGGAELGPGCGWGGRGREREGEGGGDEWKEEEREGCD